MLATHRMEDTLSSLAGGPHNVGQRQHHNPFNREDRLSMLAAHRMEDTFSSPEAGPHNGGQQQHHLPVQPGGPPLLAGGPHHGGHLQQLGGFHQPPTLSLIHI